MSTQVDFFSSFGPNSGYVRDLFNLYLNDPGLVGESWAQYFNTIVPVVSVENGTNGTLQPVAPVVATARVAAAIPEYTDGRYATGTEHGGELEQRIYRFVSAHRNRGHLRADVNPLHEGVIKPPVTEDINREFYKFSSEQLEQEYPCAGFARQEKMKLKDLIEQVESTYCGNIGFEYLHLLSQEERLWLQERIEARLDAGSYKLSSEQKIRHLQKMIDAEAFESELHKKYVGHKRFSLQGGETIIPMLNTVLEEAGIVGAREAVIGMAHRGRLNVLRNIMGKPLSEVFSDFEDQNIFSVLGSGDVKYHMGFESKYLNPRGQSLRLTLAPNPSHLEFVYPVVQGIVRARQDLSYDRDRKSVLSVIIHGDAAFIGQGIVTETLNMSNVEGYTTGGTIHLIINNQIGFTTSPDESRSSVYCTDFARAIQAPVLHVNCENVEAACWAAKLAVDFQNRYGRDVVLDLYCYRKYGHNEGDDPSFTQPLIYNEIKHKKTVAEIYGNQLVSEGVVSEADITAYYDTYSAEFSKAHEVSKKRKQMGEACAMHGRLRDPNPDTAVSIAVLKQIADTLVSFPSDFVPHPKLKQILQKRVDTLTTGEGIDWGFAEALAFGSIMADQVAVRLSGQDCGRGTFSQRHLVLNHYENGEHYTPFQQLTAQGYAPFEVYNSTLSENSVMGFEFGYSSIALNDTLVLWEAQFGDFANGAQVIIDQFISSSEQKWHQRSGIVLLLPHGYEGQGPEHSSARLERYLQLCAEGNMVVAYPSTAGQYFHLLRKQGLTEICRPMIVMTPKSLLRSPNAAVTVDKLTSGFFDPVLVNDSGAGTPEHVVFCSGKVFYDIEKALSDIESAPPVRVLRIEQLYPFPQNEISTALEGLTLKSVTWVQEEPRNMGAWFFMEPVLKQKFNLEIQYVGRSLSASTATGSSKRHVYETQQFLQELQDIVTR